MIDIADEQLVTLPALGRWLAERIEQPPTNVTLYNWAWRGVRGVTLESVRIGVRRYTSIEAFQRFSRRLAGEDNPVVPTKRREREMAAAKREAEAIFAGRKARTKGR